MGGPVLDDVDHMPAEVPDLMTLGYHWERAGIGLPRTELFCIELSIRKLAKNPAIASIK